MGNFGLTFDISRIASAFSFFDAIEGRWPTNCEYEVSVKR